MVEIKLSEISIKPEAEIEAIAQPKNWFVYMIQADDGAYYTGVTTDVERRFKEHCGGGRGARYFRGRRPVAVVYREAGHTRSSACQREAAIKKMKREQKQCLIDDSDEE